MPSDDRIASLEWQCLSPEDTAFLRSALECLTPLYDRRCEAQMVFKDYVYRTKAESGAEYDRLGGICDGTEEEFCDEWRDYAPHLLWLLWKFLKREVPETVVPCRPAEPESGPIPSHPGDGA